MNKTPKVYLYICLIITLLWLGVFMVVPPFAMAENSTVSFEKTYQISYSSQIKENNPYLPRVKLIYETAGLNLELLPQPTLRSLNNANNGVVDGEAGKLERSVEGFSNLIKVDAPIFTYTGQAYALRPDIETYKPSLLDSAKMGIKRDAQWALDAIGDRKVLKAESCRQLFELLLAKHIDVALCPSRIKNNLDPSLAAKYRAVRPLEPPIVTFPIYHYVHKSNQDIVPLLEKTIRQLTLDGTIDPRESWLK